MVSQDIPNIREIRKFTLHSPLSSESAITKLSEFLIPYPIQSLFVPFRRDGAFHGTAQDNHFEMQRDSWRSLSFITGTILSAENGCTIVIEQKQKWTLLKVVFYIGYATFNSMSSIAYGILNTLIEQSNQNDEKMLRDVLYSLLEAH